MSYLMVELPAVVPVTEPSRPRELPARSEQLARQQSELLREHEEQEAKNLAAELQRQRDLARLD